MDFSHDENVIIKGECRYRQLFRINVNGTETDVRQVGLKKRNEYHFSKLLSV